MNTQLSIHHRTLTLALSAALVFLTAPGLAEPLEQATLPLQEIAKTDYPGLKPEQVVARMIADGSNPILSAKAVAQIAPPQAAPSIAASAAAAVPEAAADIAATVAGVAPDQAVAIAVAVGKAVPAMAPQIAATVAQVAPKLAAQIAQAMIQAVPHAASAISTAVAGAVPGFAGTITGTVAAVAVGAATVLGTIAAVVTDQQQESTTDGTSALSGIGPERPPVGGSCQKGTRNKEFRSDVDHSRTRDGDPEYSCQGGNRVKTQKYKKKVKVDTYACEFDHKDKNGREFYKWRKYSEYEWVEDTPEITPDPCPSPKTTCTGNGECVCPPCAAPRILNQQTCACDCPPCNSPYSDDNCTCPVALNDNDPKVQLALAETHKDNSGGCACQQCSWTKRNAEGVSDSVYKWLRR